MIIQISSDPYKRRIIYSKVVAGKSIQIDSNAPDTPATLALLSSEYSDCFFPFKAYDIVKLIHQTYSTPSESVMIRFSGSSEEYDVFVTVCEMLHIPYERSDVCLENARDILPNINLFFEDIRPLIHQSITTNESKIRIKEQQGQFDDVSKTEIPICVIGNYSSGKSTFINALIGREILPSGDKPMTAKIYEIRCSVNDEFAKVSFKSDNNPITVEFEKGKHRINANNRNGFIYNEISNYLEQSKEKTLYERLQVILKLLNESTNECNIDDYVRIELPFNTDSPFGMSKHPFVLFDTPGDNVVNHSNHIEVLQKALQGMSNGLMLYITKNDQLETISNQALCDKVTAIPEIDTRFTMVIVNQADNADFTESNKLEIKDSTVPRALKPEGIYYVSSIMALGGKIDGEFVKDNSAMIYEEKSGRFSNPKSRFYQQLFLHNIIPPQFELFSTEEAEKYASLGENERIFVNSGLYAVENEIIRFAQNYALYNKCRQSLLFLSKVMDIAEYDISVAVKNLGNAREYYQTELEKEKSRLSDKLYKILNEFVLRTINNYPEAMSEVMRKSAETLKKDQLVELEKSYTEEREKAVNFLEDEENADSAWKKFWHGANPLSKEGRKQLLTIFPDAKDKSKKRDEARKAIDIYAADRLLAEVKQTFRIMMNSAQNEMFHVSETYWSENAHELKQRLLRIILDSEEIDPDKQARLQDLIEQFEEITFDLDTEQVFQKKDFERHALTIGSIKLFENYKLNKGRLASKYNSALNEGITYIYQKMRMSHKQRFTEWQKRLTETISRELTDLNPTLKDAKDQVVFFEERIDTLKNAKMQLKEYILKIRELMNWKPITD